MRGIAVWGFLLAVAPITMTPGTSLTLVVSRVAEGGRKPGWWVIAGTVTGLYVHVFLAAAGVAALVMRSAQAFWVIKLVGAGYLVGLGLWLVCSTARRRTTAPAAAGEHEPLPPRATARHPYLQGLLGNVLNPKAAAIYLTLAPQFLDPDHPVLLSMLTLATAHCVLHTGWLAGWTALSATTTRLLRTARARWALNRVTGTILVGIGARTAIG